MAIVKAHAGQANCNAARFLLNKTHIPSIRIINWLQIYFKAGNVEFCMHEKTPWQALFSKVHLPSHILSICFTTVVSSVLCPRSSLTNACAARTRGCVSRLRALAPLRPLAFRITLSLSEFFSPNRIGSVWWGWSIAHRSLGNKLIYIYIFFFFFVWQAFDGDLTWC